MTPKQAAERLRVAVEAGVVTTEEIIIEVGKHGTNGVVDVRSDPDVLIRILNNLLEENNVATPAAI